MSQEIHNAGSNPIFNCIAMMHSIAHHLKARLVPFIYVNRAFDHFSTDMQESGIFEGVFFLEGGIKIVCM